MGCLICERIEQIKRGETPYFVCELSTGYVVLGDHQRFQGYTLFLSKQHVTELYHLPWEIRTRFLQEMSLVAEAVAAVYHPDKMNYELLGNGDTHLHCTFSRGWQAIPRSRVRSGGCRGRRCGTTPFCRPHSSLRSKPVDCGRKSSDAAGRQRFFVRGKQGMCNGLPGKKLPPEFYLQDTVQVARQLIGKLLVRRVEGQTLSAIICETEAYTGFSDKACHSYKGSSPRTRIMFEAGGRAYVYLIYGMYSCLNVTTREEGVPEAVLIRAASPVEGIERMMQLRQSKKPIKSLKENTLLSGPGRLCDALAITREQNGLSLCGDELFICEGVELPQQQIAATPRINIDYAQEAKDYLYRFVDTKNPCLSVKYREGEQNGRTAK